MTVTDDVKYGRQALSAGEPWITPGSLAKLNEIIQPDWRVFEWGSGGSTVYFARHCAFTYSAEHHSDWYMRTIKRLQSEHLFLTKAVVVYFKADKEQGAERFKPYADLILDLPDESLDLVFVDGEASSRGWCLNNALPKVKPGGWLLLDNSNWFKRELPDWERFDYVERNLTWIGQKEKFDWWTTLLMKK